MACTTQQHTVYLWSLSEIIRGGGWLIMCPQRWSWFFPGVSHPSGSHVTERLSFHFCAVVVSLNSPLPSLSLEAKDAGNIFRFVPRYVFLHTNLHNFTTSPLLLLTINVMGWNEDKRTNWKGKRQGTGWQNQNSESGKVLRWEQNT